VARGRGWPEIGLPPDARRPCLAAVSVIRRDAPGSHRDHAGYPAGEPRRGQTVKQIRIQRHRTRGERPWQEVLPLDPRDPDVVRVKSLARQRVAGRAPRRPQGAR